MPVDPKQRMRSPTSVRVFVWIFVCVAVCFAQSKRDPGAAKNPFAGKAEAIEAGQKRFREGCAACHGANAEGGRGPNLNESSDLRRITDEQLFATIRHGIPGTDMPASPMPDNSVWEVEAFVRSLNSPAFSVPVRGNVKAGSELFFGKAQCSDCHMVRGKGGYLGPDLTNIAATSTERQLRESILNPSARITPGFTGVAVELKNGSRIQGVAKNYSNYSLQILDATGTLHLLNTIDVKEIELRRKSIMPGNYSQRLSPAELENILSFLSRQVVRPEAPPADREQWEVH